MPFALFGYLITYLKWLFERFLCKLDAKQQIVELKDGQLMKTNGANIINAADNPRGEIRIENISVDGFKEEMNTIFSYHGCLFQEHSCSTKSDNASLWEATVDRETNLKYLRYNMVSMKNC